MKNHISLIILIFALLFQNCKPYNNFVASRLISKGKLSQNSSIQIIGFEERSGVIIIKAKVNGSEKEYDFILDSGAAYTIISKEVADELNLNPKAVTEMTDFSGIRNTMDIIVLDKVNIANYEFSDIAAGIVDFSNNPIYSCIANGGIIGTNLMHLCNWEINYQEKEIKITDHSIKPGNSENSIIIPFKTFYNIYRPYIDIETEYFKLSNCLVDIGSASGITVPTEYCDMKKVKRNEKVNTMIGEANEGIYGSIIDTVYYFNSDSLKFNSGSYLLNPQVKVMNHNGLTIGNSLFNKSIVTLDYIHNNLIIDNPEESEIFEIPNYGFSLEYKDNTVYVDAIFENSISQKAGLSLGDVILEVNEQPVNSYFSNYCDFILWKQSLLNNSHTLLLKVNNKANSISLIKENN